MRFFIETARVEEIKKANDMGVISGIAASPSLIAGAGGEAFWMDGPVCYNMDAAIVDAEDMIAEGRAIAAFHPNMVTGLPLTAEGLKACRALAAEGIRVNVTMMFSANQALQAARAGAAYVSPFSGRLNDVSQRGVDLIREIADLFSVCEVDTQIIATNVHDLARARDCEEAGADIAVVPYAMMEQLLLQPLTEGGIAKDLDEL